VSQARVDELYGKWGGIPRYVLEKANNIKDQDGLEVAIKNCSISDVTTYTGSEKIPDHVCNKLLHVTTVQELGGQVPPRQLYSKCQIVVASEYVANALTGK